MTKLVRPNWLIKIKISNPKPVTGKSTISNNRVDIIKVLRFSQIRTIRLIWELNLKRTILSSSEDLVHSMRQLIVLLSLTPNQTHLDPKIQPKCLTASMSFLSSQLSTTKLYSLPKTTKSQGNIHSS